MGWVSPTRMEPRVELVAPRVRGSTQSLTGDKQGEHRNALTCGFEPEVGFEPTTFRLRVGKHSSSRCRPDPFWLLTSERSSAECVPDLPCYGRRNDQENNRPLVGHRRP
jgi:hypothetical protein